MDFLRQWLFGVVGCAFLTGLLDQLTPEGAIRPIARLCGGLVLLLCLLRPLGAVELRELDLVPDDLSAQRAALETQYAAENDRALAAVIAERTGAYIEDKAHALGLEVTAEVEVAERGGTLVPCRVTLYGAESEALAACMERELDIARTEQEWRAAE